MKDIHLIRHFRKSTFWMRCFAVAFVLGGFGGIEPATASDANKLHPAKNALELSDASWIKPSSIATAAPGSSFSQSTLTTKEEFLKQRDRSSARQLLEATPANDFLVSQASNTDDTEQLRRQLRLDPLEELRIPGYSPGSAVGVPTAFGADFGDAFIGLFFANRRPRINDPDSALSVGFGLGDSERALGLEISANIGSLRRFGRNGDIGFKLHRALPGKASIALGFDSGIRWGEEAERIDSTLYAAASKVFDLRPGNVENSLPLTLTLGVGGGRFRSYSNIVNNRGGVGVFASAGLRVIPQASIIGSWTGQDLNLGVSYVPIKTTPLFLTFAVGNVLNRNDSSTVFSFGIGYGFNYLGGQY